MNIKPTIRKWAWKRGYFMEKAIKGSEAAAFITRFRENYVSVELARFGGNGDGGYLLPPFLNEVKYCFSPGVDRTASFESQLSAEYGITSFMADASVDAPPFPDNNFKFIQKFLGSETRGEFITLSDWVSQSIDTDQAPKILQMDIEGAEYEVLTHENEDTLASFSAIIVEFHGLQNIFERNFFRMLNGVFNKMYKNFNICHVHPNNCAMPVQWQGVYVPPVIEVSFIRHDIAERFANDSRVTLPHPLDFTNVTSHPDFAMPELWWKK